MNMPTIEETFAAAVASRDIPGAVIAASSTDGLYKYTNVFGVSSLKDEKPLDYDALFWMGSQTKILTAIAALQCVEKGHFTLEEDVTRLVPELKDIQVKEKSGDDVVLVPSKKKITLRNLLTHTSGLSYTKFGQLDLPFLERILAPLEFEPGEGFFYGTGTDFAGLMVERVSGLTLENYIQKHVTAPLGIQSICFHPKSSDEKMSRLADVSIRKEASGPVEWTPEKIWPLDITEDSGGSGSYATIVEFHKILCSLTANDGLLLTSSMVDELYRPDMTPAVREGVMKVLTNETANNIYGGLPKGTDATYAMGGMVVLQDLPDRRPRGTMHWGHLLNCFFWTDRTNGVTGIFGSQVFPAGDIKCLALFAEFEREVYKKYHELKGQK